MADQARARKLADRIREIAADTLERRVKDPRLGFVTVTDARITGDLREATVFYTVYGDATAQAETAAALTSVTGLVRSEVGRQTGVRYTPTVAFVLDAVPENAASIEDALARARAIDAEVAAVAEGAGYAGDADPYRHPGEDAEGGDDAGEDAGDDGDTEPDQGGGDPVEDSTEGTGDGVGGAPR